MNKIRVGIVGGAGYTGGELIRILINHPLAEIVFVHSKSNNGKTVDEVHTDLLGDISLKFTNGVRKDMHMLFLCVSHGEASKFLAENEIQDSIKIIDLSQDFRITNSLSSDKRAFTYGLTELNRDAIKLSNNIANPGCFATCIQISLLPLAAYQLLNGEIHVSATTGSTGAGQMPNPTSHYSWRNNNLSFYKAFEHKHLAEISQGINQLQPNFENQINFVPQRGSFCRGIYSTCYTDCDLSLAEVKSIYETYYSDHPFVFISEKNIDLKQVVNTNKCMLYIEKHGSKILIAGIIDNLLKGASGQAVQNMNLMFGLEETLGLKLKASAF